MPWYSSGKTLRLKIETLHGAECILSKIIRPASSSGKKGRKSTGNIEGPAQTSRRFGACASPAAEASSLRAQARGIQAMSTTRSSLFKNPMSEIVVAHRHRLRGHIVTPPQQIFKRTPDTATPHGDMQLLNTCLQRPHNM